MRTSISVYVFAGLMLGACSSNGPADLKPTDTAATSIPGGMAIRRLAEQTGAAPEQITLVSEEAVNFSDSSLGCPKPDMAYLQVITPGSKVVLEYAGKNYDLRVAGGRALICDPPEEAGTVR